MMRWSLEEETSFGVSGALDRVDIMVRDLVMAEASHEEDILHIEDMDLAEVTIIQDIMETNTGGAHLVHMGLHQ